MGVLFGNVFRGSLSVASHLYFYHKLYILLRSLLPKKHCKVNVGNKKPTAGKKQH